MPRIELICISPLGCSSTSFERRVRSAAEGLLAAAQIGITSFLPGDAPALVAGSWSRFASCSSAPTLVVVIHGRVMAHAIGDLPPRELHDLMATALRNAGTDPSLALVSGA